MGKLFDKNVVAQTGWDSAALKGLATIVRRFTNAGEHQVILEKDGKVVSKFPLRVERKASPSLKSASTESTSLTASKTTPPAAGPLNIDLVRLERPGKEKVREKLVEHFSTATDDYVLFEATGEAEGYSVVSRMQEKGKETETFNSQRLTQDDFFTVILVRAGKYLMKNLLTSSQGTLTMSYPVVGDKPYQPPEPARIHCTTRGFEPTEITLQPFQGVVFEFEVPSRIKIDLVEPIDKEMIT